MKVLAVGDIHTKTRIINLVESVVNDYDAVVFCGDYADDFGAEALDTIRTWQRLMDLQQTYDNVKLVLGNHDYAYLHNVYCSGHNYTTETLLNAPENRPLKDWLYALPITIEIDDVTYAHAGLDQRWTSEDYWEDISPLWTRPDWAVYKKVKQVVGHTPQSTVTEVEPGIWVIDTFSTYPNGVPIGDGSMLEITDGQTFTKINLNDNHDTHGIEDNLS